MSSTHAQTNSLRYKKLKSGASTLNTGTAGALARIEREARTSSIAKDCFWELRLSCLGGAGETPALPVFSRADGTPSLCG